MDRNEVVTYIFSSDLQEKFYNNLETLMAYGIVGCETDVRYIDILKELKPIIEWYTTDANKEDIINWSQFFYIIIGTKDTNKFIKAVLDLDLSMKWE